MTGRILYACLLIWKYLRYVVLTTAKKLIDLFEIMIKGEELLPFLNNTNRQLILFITDKYMPRAEKIAFALKSLNNYNLVLITRFPLKEDSCRYYQAIIAVRSPLKTLWMVKKMNPFVIHVFSSWNFDQAHYLLKYKKKFQAKVIFDDYDVFAGMLQKKHTTLLFPTQDRKEKYCLENADGHCCRSLETQYAKRVLHYKISRRRIFFPEYMWDEPVKKATVKINYLVYVGNFNEGVVTLARELKKISWYLEIFSAFFVRKKPTLLPDNLIVNNPVPPEKLIEVLRLFPVSIQLPGCILDSTNSIYTADKYKYAASGKIFDYLEAGLLILISDELFQKWILKRYGAAVEINEKDSLEDIIRKLSNFGPHYSNRKKAPCSHLTLQNQVRRLDEFYHTLTTLN